MQIRIRPGSIADKAVKIIRVAAVLITAFAAFAVMNSLAWGMYLYK